ncbi:MAG: YjjG family noncanonical pyrimidine nucleotidase [Oscillospiraceae bacterium]|nr:YjjG family noncanonical pyrimidine nucleotidase [Oscillospiraceae bacterium]
MIEYLFLDLDDTILDFAQAERVALAKTLTAFGVEPTAERIDRYSRINKDCWKRMEQGELTRDQLRTVRFAEFFAELDMEADVEAVAKAYVDNLAVGHFFLPGAEEAVERLSKKYRLFLASNGMASVQKGRMTSANLYRFFERSFISEEMGAAKPAKAYFDAAFATIPGFDPAKAIMVGDSLTSDIQGGINAGIRTCWVNPGRKTRRADVVPHHEIASLGELEALLETL